MDFLLRPRLSVTVERDLRNIHFKNKDMRIKINDKIYRLKEIESGVDSLMELVEEPKYKDGDFVVNEAGSILIFKKEVGGFIYDHAYFSKSLWRVIFADLQTGSPIKCFATEDEKQRMLDALAKKGKRWNEEKLRVEDIPQPKFKKGDKVRIKKGISSKTHQHISPGFIVQMDDLIGEELTVDRYANGMVYTEESYYFHEEWLEPYVEELKKGDLAIFWDSDQAEARIGAYNQFYDGSPFPHEDHIGNGFRKAIKFESKEQFEKLINGEL